MKKNNRHKSKVAIIGTGPAGLMAASILSDAGIQVTLFEKRKGPGSKLLIAGKSGLNISHNDEPVPLWENYQPDPSLFKRLFSEFSRNDWIEFIHSLGVETFLGSSGRYFIEGLKTPPLLKSWLKYLKERCTEFIFDREFMGLMIKNGKISVQFTKDNLHGFDAALLALGGGSWKSHAKGIKWLEYFNKNHILCVPFTPANAGFNVSWNESFLKEAQGKPIKNCKIHSPEGIFQGELMITRYGLEGTPVYHLRKGGRVTLDLKPELSLTALRNKLEGVKENLSPIRRIKKSLRLSEGALALIYHHGELEKQPSMISVAKLIKSFPLELLGSRSLDESISSSGGVDFSELSQDYQLKKIPGVFLAGEMIHWDAPTGGYLIQGCVSQGAVAARGILDFLSR